MRRARLGLAALALLLAAPAGATITGVCPDGSMFVVQKSSDIPCPEAKRVHPSELPPIKPEYLPRPHAWQVFQDRQDPNNPYNLVDGARDVRDHEAAMAGRPPAPATPQQPPTAESAPSPTPAPAVAAPPAPTPVFDDAEIRDLALIVALSQEHVPARFARRGRDGGESLVVALAHSPAFAGRFNANRGAPDGAPVVLFAAESAAPETFHANLTFVQGHRAFHPDRANPREFGVLAGALGELAPGEPVLGYVALPEEIDLARPIDIYWNDHRIETPLIR